MSLTLGLDLGTNSIGWALVEDGKRIVKTGVRIFPMGVNQDTSGKELSRNAARRAKRSARRAYYRYVLRRKKLLAIFDRLGITPGDELIKLPSYELYKLRKRALDEQLTLKEIARIWYLLNQRRGFKSSRKDKNAETEKNDPESIKGQISELAQLIERNGFRTVGEYFFELFDVARKLKDWHNPEQPYERIRGRFVSRKMYEDEFDAIWRTQSEFYPGVLTDDLYREIKNETIFYQRKLKSQKHLVANCRFETKKKVAPKSSLELQEFRIWQTISNLRVTDDTRYMEPLTLEEKHILAGQLNTVEKMTIPQVKKLLGLTSRDKVYSSDDSEGATIKGNSTASRIIKVVGLDFWKNIPLSYDGSDQADTGFKYLNKKNLWHLLFFADDPEWLKNYAIAKLNFDEQTATLFASIPLEEDYGSISSRALLLGKDGNGGILSFLKEGYDYAEAAAKAGYHHSQDVIVKEPDGLIKRRKGDRIDGLRNPVVQQTLGEAVRLVNAITKRFGRIERIRVEMARSLKKPKKIREQLTSENRKKAMLRNEYISFLKEKGYTKISGSLLLKFELWLELDFWSEDFVKLAKDLSIDEFKKFARSVRPSDKEKFRLWLECGRVSPYSGKPVSLSKLFSPEIEIEHIVPYSRSLDDSFMNKTLCEREINQNKLNMTPREYFKENTKEWNDFLLRVKNFNQAKQEKFLIQELPEDFDPAQLTNNAWVAREAVKIFKTVCDNVQVTNGQTTAHIRRSWGLSAIINSNDSVEKNRDDHRHHAVDALTIATTEIKHIQLLSRFSQLNGSPVGIPNIPYPWDGFRRDAVDHLSTLIVSHRNKKRLITSKKNKYKIKGNVKSATSHSIRGSLHDETNYGIRGVYEPGKEIDLVSRTGLQNLTDLKGINSIVDDGIRDYISSIFLEDPKGFAAKTKEGIHMFDKFGKPLPRLLIKKVRVSKKSNNIVSLKPNTGKGLFVQPGNNYKIAIYENPVGKRCAKVISFFEAVSKAKENLPMFDKDFGDFRLKYELTHNDMFLATEETDTSLLMEDKEYIFSNLYRLRKFDANFVMTWQLHFSSGSDRDKLIQDRILRKNHSTLKGFKITIDNLGEIHFHD